MIWRLPMLFAQACCHTLTTQHNSYFLQRPIAVEPGLVRQLVNRTAVPWSLFCLVATRQLACKCHLPSPPAVLRGHDTALITTGLMLLRCIIRRSFVTAAGHQRLLRHCSRHTAPVSTAPMPQKQPGSTPSKSPAAKRTPKKQPPAVVPDAALLDKAARILAQLQELYPNPPVPLEHDSPFQLLVAVMLSAQTTDKKVQCSGDAATELCVLSSSLPCQADNLA